VSVDAVHIELRRLSWLTEVPDVDAGYFHQQVSDRSCIRLNELRGMEQARRIRNPSQVSYEGDKPALVPGSAERIRLQQAEGIRGCDLLRRAERACQKDEDDKSERGLK